MSTVSPNLGWNISTLFSSEIRTINDYVGIKNQNIVYGRNSENYLKGGIYNPKFCLYILNQKVEHPLRLLIKKGTTFVFSYSLRNLSKNQNSVLLKRTISDDEEHPIFTIKCEAVRDISYELDHSILSKESGFSKYFLTATLNYNFKTITDKTVNLLSPEFKFCTPKQETGHTTYIELPNEDSEKELNYENGYLTSYLILGVLNRLTDEDIIKNFSSSSTDKTVFYNNVCFSGYGLDEYKNLNSKTIVPVDYNYNLSGGDVYYHLGELKINTNRGNYIYNECYPWYYLYNQTDIINIGDYDPSYKQISSFTDLENFSGFTLEDTLLNEIKSTGKKEAVIYTIPYLKINEIINSGNINLTNLANNKIALDKIKTLNIYEVSDSTIINDDSGFINTDYNNTQYIENLYGKFDINSGLLDDEIKNKTNTNGLIPLDITKENHKRLIKLISNKSLFSNFYYLLQKQEETDEDEEIYTKDYTYIPICVGIRRIHINGGNITFDKQNSKKICSSVNILPLQNTGFTTINNSNSSHLIIPII